MSKLKIEKVVVAKVVYYETLHVIRDERGEQIFVGSEETAKRVAKLLKKQRPKRKKKRK